jgi:hypothetical protein
MECVVVLVTCCFRYLASAPKVCWRARAGAPARACSHNHKHIVVFTIYSAHARRVFTMCCHRVPGGGLRAAAAGGAGGGGGGGAIGRPAAGAAAGETYDTAAR